MKKPRDFLQAVFDANPGISKRWVPREMTEEEKVEAQKRKEEQQKKYSNILFQDAERLKDLDLYLVVCLMTRQPMEQDLTIRTFKDRDGEIQGLFEWMNCMLDFDLVITHPIFERINDF